MKRPELTEQESALYMKIVTMGTMDDMFDLGYTIGRERLATESLTELEKSTSLQDKK